MFEDRQACKALQNECTFFEWNNIHSNAAKKKKKKLHGSKIKWLIFFEKKNVVWKEK